MSQIEKDSQREERIDMEVVVDCYDESKRAMGWYYYLDDNLEFPFPACCIAERVISPLHVDDEVDVIGMAPETECEHDMFVLIRREKAELAVPLSLLKPVAANEQTIQAIEDWHYWIQRGYQF